MTEVIKLKLRHKFIVGFSPLLVIILIFSFSGLKVFSSINQLIINLNKNIAPSSAILEFKEVLNSLDESIAVRDINTKKTEGRILKLQALVKRHLSRKEPGYDLPPEAAKQVRNHAIKIMTMANSLLNLTRHGWRDKKDLEVIHANIRQERVVLSTLLNEHLSSYVRALSATEKVISDRYHQGVFVAFIAIVFGLLVAFFMIFYLMRAVLTPIKILREGSEQLGNGCLDYEISIKTGDEFEELAGAFRSMAGKLAESYRHLDQKVMSRTKALSQINEALEKEIGERIEAEKEQQRAEDQVHVLTQELIKIQEKERTRMALDLHDNVAQELSALKVLSETIFADQSNKINQDELQKNMGRWATVLKQCIGTVRELSYNLRPPLLEQMGIKSALAEYCREFSKKNLLPIDFSAAGMDQLSMTLDYDVAINIYRLVQEALNNIKEHAHAGYGRVRLVASGPNIVLKIEDDGIGCDLAAVNEKVLRDKHLGLLGMRERARALDGSVKFISRPGEGMKIFLEIPWRKRDGSVKEDHNC